MGISTSKTDNAPWKGAQPFLTSGANAVQDAYNTNAGGIQNYTNQVTGLIPSMIDKYQAGNPAINSAQNYNVDVLSGKYLNQGNPFLQQQIDNTNNDVRNQTSAALGLHGGTGGSAYADIISRNLAKNENTLRYGDYANERNLMGQAAGQAPALAAADTIQIAPLLSTLNASATPINAANSYAGALNSLFGQYNSKSATPSTFDQIGNGISAAGSIMSLFSDRRLKTDIRRVGSTDAGLPIYTFRYQGAGPVHMGVMANEVAEMQPQALGPDVGGFATVFYGEVR